MYWPLGTVSSYVPPSTFDEVDSVDKFVDLSRSRNGQLIAAISPTELFISRSQVSNGLIYLST